jgi:uncharacterized protein with HEPN domain
MSKRGWRVILADILESINKIENYVEGVTYQQFIQDDKTKDAVVRNLEIIGESANQIPKNIRQKFSDVPWPQIIGLRNKMIHGYFVVDYRIVWEIVKKDIPSLRRKIELISRVLPGEIEENEDT